MRKLKLFSVLMCLFIGIGQMWGAKITSVSNIQSGKKYYIGATKSNSTDYYLSVADHGASAATGKQGSAVTNKTDAEVFTFTKSGDNWSIQFESGKYLSLASTKANGKVDVVASAANWAITNSSNLLQLKINNYCLKCNSQTTTANFGSYSSGQLDVWLEEVSGGSSNPTVSTNPTSLTFDAAEVGGSAPSAKTFTISGSNLTSALTISSSNTNLYTCAVTSGSLTPSSKSVTATITVTPQAAITESAGTKEANIVISGGGLAESVNVALSTTVTAPAHVYQYTHDFTNINGFSSWGSSYGEHVVNYDIYNGHIGNDDKVVFASANKQSSTITDRPVTKGGDVCLVLLDDTKYISAVKFVCKQWNTNTQTITLNYSTDGGENYSVFDPSITSTNFSIENLDLPNKTNAVKITFSKTGNSSQVGISSVSFDLVDKVTYAINKSATGCTLSVTDGTSAITSAEAGDEVYVSIAETTDGYENATISVKDADDNTIIVTNGKFIMPAKAVTVTATATKKQYTVTLAATNGKIQVGGEDKTSIDIEHGDEVTLSAVADEDYAFNGWSSSDYTISTPSNNPLSITIEKAGTITANFISTAKLNPGFAWSVASAEAVKGQEASLPTLDNPNGLHVVYSSSNTSVAGIDDEGNVTINGVGSATIKATFTENEDYAGDEKSYTLNVKGRITWHVIKDGTDVTTTEDYAKDETPVMPTPASCDESIISLVGWTTSTYAKSNTAPEPLYTNDVPEVTDNADYYAVWAKVEEGGWVETALADLTSSDVFVFSDGSYALNNNGGTTTAPTANAITVSAGKITSSVADNLKWNISGNSTDGYTFYPNESTTAWLYCNTSAASGSNNNIRVGTGDRKVFELNASGYLVTKDASTMRYLCRYQTQDFRFYVNTTTDNTTATKPKFYKYTEGSASDYTTNCVAPLTVAAPAFNVEAGTYTSVQTVTITCATVGATIYYSLDGSEPSTAYTTPIEIKETRTLKAKAVLEDVTSEIAEATFTINLPLTTIPDIFNAATTTSNTRMITFDNWVVSGVKADGTQAFLTDGTNGIILFHKNVDMQLKVGNTLSGTKECSLILFNGAAELQDFSTEGLTVGTNGVVTPVSKSIADLGGINTGAPVIISNVTYNGTNSTLVDEDNNAIKLYTTLYNYGSTFVNNKIYSVTGIYLQYSNTKELLPRQSKDIVLESKEQPTLKWYVSSAKEVEIGATYKINKDDAFAPVCEVNSGGTITYTSSVSSVATIGETSGVLTIEGVGTTVIRCSVEANGDYLAGYKEFTLTIKPEGTAEVTWVAKDWANITSGSKDLDIISADDNVDMTWDKGTNTNNPPKYYANGEAARVYNGNTLTLTSKNSKIITGVTFTFSDGSLPTNCASEGTYDVDSKTWNGFASSVTFTSSASIRITKIDIEYAQGTTTTLVIEDMIILDNASATDIVFTSNKPGAVVTYSDYDEDVITIAEGKVTPVAIGNTTVKASIAAEAPYSSVSITFNVRVKSSSETVENVVILSQFGEGWIAMKHDFTAVEVEKAADGTILDLTCDEEDITWVMTADGTSAMFQQPSTNKYLAVGSSNALVLSDDATVWTLSGDGYYYNVSGRTFLYQGAGTKYKNYSAGNAGKATDGGYSQLASFVAPVFANRADLRSVTNGQWGTYCPDHEVKYVEGASFYTIAYVEKQGEVPYKVFYDEIGEGESLQAGHPYIFIADEDATAIKGVKVGDAATEGINDNGFIGKLSQYDFYVSAEASNAYKYYIVYGNEIRRCGEGWFRISAERAYLDMTAGINTVANAPAAGRRRVCLTNQEVQIATGVDQVQSDQVQSTKVLINGELFILRGEKMYDATGRLVK